MFHLQDMEMSNDLNITICFTVGTGWSSKLIRWFTFSKISHAMVVFDDHSLGARLCLSADSNGFVLKPFEKDKHSVRAEFKPVGPDLTESLRWLSDRYLNTKYDFWSAGMTGIKRRFKRLWKWIKNWAWSKKNLHKVMCSESVIRMEGKAGYISIADLEPELTDAQVLMDSHMENSVPINFGSLSKIKHAEGNTKEFELLYLHSNLYKEYLN